MSRDGVTPVIRNSDLTGDLYAFLRNRYGTDAIRAGATARLKEAILTWWRRTGLEIIEDYRNVRLGNREGTIAFTEINGVRYWGHNSEMYSQHLAGLGWAANRVGLGFSKDEQRELKDFYTGRRIFLSRGHERLWKYDIIPEKVGHYIRNAFSHAEVQSFLQAIHEVVEQGSAIPKRVVLVVDRMPCIGCTFALTRLKEYFGIEEIVILYRQNPLSEISEGLLHATL